MSWIKELKTVDPDVLDQHIKQSINTRFYTRITNLNACIRGSKSKWAQRYWTGVKEAVQRRKRVSKSSMTFALRFEFE